MTVYLLIAFKLDNLIPDRFLVSEFFERLDRDGVNGHTEIVLLESATFGPWSVFSVQEIPKVETSRF